LWCEITTGKPARRPVEVGHGIQPQGRVADQAGGVGRRRGRLQRIQIAGHVGEAEIGGLAQQVERRRRRPGAQAERRQADAAVSNHHRGDALAHLGGHRRVAHERPVVMGVHVDEARRDDTAAGVQLGLAHGRVQSANGNDAIAGHRHVGGKARPAAAIDHGATADH
jgi:hypothetical protein